VDGRGTLVRGGARVVKNAAGFDLPKLLCGSLGRLGLLVELTFKVFPRPSAETTLAIACPSAGEAVAVMARAANSRWEPDALDYNPAAGAVWLRLAHAPATLDALAAEIAALWPGRVTRLDPAAAAAAWQGVTEWEESTLGAAVAKVPLTPARIPEFDAAFAHAPGLRIHYSVGGNLAWLGWNGPVPDALDGTLRNLRLPGLLLRGEGPLHLGAQPSRAIDAAITRALDPDGRFA
jgi:glycolate oxidase FAD binding subunit